MPDQQPHGSNETVAEPFVHVDLQTTTSIPRIDDGGIQRPGRWHGVCGVAGHMPLTNTIHKCPSCVLKNKHVFANIAIFDPEEKVPKWHRTFRETTNRYKSYQPKIENSPRNSFVPVVARGRIVVLDFVASLHGRKIGNGLVAVQIQNQNNVRQIMHKNKNHFATLRGQCGPNMQLTHRWVCV